MAWATTDDCLRVSLKRMIEIWKLQPGSTVCNTSLHWTRKGEKESFANIGVNEFGLGLDGKGVLRIRFSKNSGPVVEQTIWLVTTQPHYGGLRWWFVCPATGKKCLYLYSAPRSERFASRRAFGLRYESQKENHWDRLMRRYHKVKDRFKAPDWTDEWFPRPKGMHQRTYERGLVEVERLGRAIDMRFMMGAAKLLGMEEMERIMKL